MPPPTVIDSWLTSRRFGIVIDAGSSGSRLQIYSWIDAQAVRLDHESLDQLPQVEKGTKEPDKWISKVEPGLASFANRLEDIEPYLAPFLSHARDHVPPSLQGDTPIFLLATAGMRLLPPQQQTAVLSAACDFLRFHSHFKVEAASDKGPCGTHVRVISGEEEGLFGWIAVNYLMDGFSEGEGEEASTYGFLDMGGASTQIAFEPRKEIREAPDEALHEVRLRLLDGREVTHDVFVTTWLGYGTNQARERYVAKTINNHELNDDLNPDIHGDEIPDPCLPKNLKRLEKPAHIGDSTSHTKEPHILVGTGSFEHCLQETSSLLNKTASCIDPPCLFNGVHVPPIDFEVSKFIGVSEYWYSSEHVFGLGGAYNFVQYERAASEFCGSDWSEIVRHHEAARKAGQLGGDGEVERQGEVVAVGKWGFRVELSRLEMQCFKAAWIVNVLHEGIGLPRTVDPAGNITAESNEISRIASAKGLGAPMFQSLDAIQDTAISWTLGKMVLEASQEVPPLSGSISQLPDPLELKHFHQSSQSHYISPINKKPTIQDQSIPPWRLLLVSYLLILFGLFFLVFLIRHKLRTSWRKVFRRHRKRDNGSMEEGKQLNGNGKLFAYSPEPSRPGTPDSDPSRKTLGAVVNQFRRTLSSRSLNLSPPASIRMKPYVGWSPSPPISLTKNFTTTSSQTSGLASPTAQCSSTYPQGAQSALDSQAVLSSHPLYALSLSRNSSQINLVPRQPISRGVSGSLSPNHR